jgi:hypothetical protein
MPVSKAKKKEAPAVSNVAINAKIEEFLELERIAGGYATARQVRESMGQEKFEKLCEKAAKAAGGKAPKSEED